MKLYKDISFWCIVLAIVVVMVVHHFLSKSSIIEGNENDETQPTTADGAVSSHPIEKCGGGSGIPCCWYNMWQDVEGESIPPIKNALENLKTDGNVYLPLDGVEGEGRTDDSTWEECQQRCIDTPGCVYFNRFGNGACHITDGSGGEQIGFGAGRSLSSHSGRALALRENIPESQMTALDQCKCAAAGEEPVEGWGDTGTPIDQSALQYGNNRDGSDVDCSSTPTPSSCDAYGQSISSTIDPTQATHFKCLVKSEVDDNLRNKAVSLGMDISGIDTNSDSFQSAIRGLMLEHISIRKSHNPPLAENASQNDLDSAIARNLALREKYNCPVESCNYTELQQKKDALRTEYNLDVDVGEDEIDRAIDMRSDILSQYGVMMSDTWKEDLEAAMGAQNATMIDLERVKYCGNTTCDSSALATAKDNWYSQRTQYNLPRDATSEELQATISAISLYDFIDEGESFEFNNCGAEGHEGPTLNDCKNTYAGDWVNNDSFFTMCLNYPERVERKGIQVWTVPESGEYEVDAYGAKGGGILGGLGARMKSRFSLTKGDKYMILCGQQGGVGRTTSLASSGGGGTFFVKGDDYSNVVFADLQLVASGGGGQGSVGHGGYEGQGGHSSNTISVGSAASRGTYGTGGGGGLIANGLGHGYNNTVPGLTGGHSFKNGGGGGDPGEWTTYSEDGRFGGFGGGGGASIHAGAGGGGVNGGAGANPYNTSPNGKGGDSHTKGTSIVSTSGENDGHGKIIITLISRLNNLGDTTTSSQYSDTITLPMPQEPTTSQATGGSVDCSDKIFLGVADTIRHNGHNASWGNSMIASKGTTNGDEGITCDDYYYYKPNTLGDLETEQGGGWSNSVREDGEAGAGFYTLQNSGVSGGNQCTNWSVRVNHPSKVNYTCSDQGPKELIDPIYGPSGAILQGLGSSLDSGSLPDSSVEGATWRRRYTITTCGVSGMTPPTTSECSELAIPDKSSVHSYSGGIHTFTFPSNGVYSIEVAGGAGGYPKNSLSRDDAIEHTWGHGAILKGNFTFSQNDQVKLLVGQKGIENADGNTANGGGGGGGGSFIWKEPSGRSQATLLIAAGGGGGRAIHGHYVYGAGANGSLGEDGTMGIPIYRSSHLSSFGPPNLDLPAWAATKGSPGTGGENAARATSGGEIAKGWSSIVAGSSMNGVTRSHSQGSGFGGGGCSNNHAGGGGGGYSGGGIFNYRGSGAVRCETGNELKCTDALGGGGGGSYFNTNHNSGSERVDSSDSSIGYNDDNGYIKIIGPL